MVSQLLKSAEKQMPLPHQCLQVILQDHNYGAPLPRTPPPHTPTEVIKNPLKELDPLIKVVKQTSQILNQVDDDTASAISSEVGREIEPEGEETETAPEGGDDEDSITRCICDFEHDDGYMICCDQCSVWQHVDCMGIDRTNIPDEYLCEECRPRRVDRARARALQMRKREELLNSDTSSDSSSCYSTDTDVSCDVTKNCQHSMTYQSIRKKKSDLLIFCQTGTGRIKNSTKNVNKQKKSNNSLQLDSISSNKKEASDTSVPTFLSSNTSTTISATENVDLVSTQVIRQRRELSKKSSKKYKTLVDDKKSNVQKYMDSNTMPVKWTDTYEEAVTNHYSPELRAKISGVKINGTMNELKQSNVQTITEKCCVDKQSHNIKFLVSTMFLPANTPVIELRGKYMLSTQHKVSILSQQRQHLQQPGSFVFFYRLPQDGIEVCVDTRTYGNNARFVRRSCKPNAEIKHCIEKGVLHLYIVTSMIIEKNSEITIGHNQHGAIVSKNYNTTHQTPKCNCNNAKTCELQNFMIRSLDSKVDSDCLYENIVKREKKRRGRKRKSVEKLLIKSDESIPLTEKLIDSIVTSTSTKKSISRRIKENIKTNGNNMAFKTTNNHEVQSSVSAIMSITHELNKEDIHQSQNFHGRQSCQSSRDETITNLNTKTELNITLEKKDKKKLTREERKMEAIIKAFERLEKAEQRKQEVRARNTQRKESYGTNSDNDDSSYQTSKCKQLINEKTPRRKKRKGRTRSMSTIQLKAARRMRQSSAESDIITSGDENNSIQLSPPTMHKCLNSNAEISQSTTSVDAGLLLALANPNDSESCLMMEQEKEITFFDKQTSPIQQAAHIKSPNGDSGTSSSSQNSTPSTPLSSACLLVAAAVEPLAPGFKFPKTKKLLINEWLKEDQPSQINDFQRFEPFLVNAEQLPESHLHNSATKSLATLVQAAQSVSCMSHKYRLSSKREMTDSPTLNSTSLSSGGSAKKRWLRQAISEECDSPTSNRPESPPNEMVAPPKKRRTARESLSSDNNTPPTTPTMILPDSLVISCQHSINEDDIMERISSFNTDKKQLSEIYDISLSREEVDSGIEMVNKIDETVEVRPKEEQQLYLSTKSEKEVAVGTVPENSMDTSFVSKKNLDNLPQCKLNVRCSSNLELETNVDVNKESQLNEMTGSIVSGKILTNTDYLNVDRSAAEVSATKSKIELLQALVCQSEKNKIITLSENFYNEEKTCMDVTTNAMQVTCKKNESVEKYAMDNRIEKAVGCLDSTKNYTDYFRENPCVYSKTNKTLISKKILLGTSRKDLDSDFEYVKKKNKRKKNLRFIKNSCKSVTSLEYLKKNDVISRANSESLPQKKESEKIEKTENCLRDKISEHKEKTNLSLKESPGSSTNKTIDTAQYFCGVKNFESVEDSDNRQSHTSHMLSSLTCKKSISQLDAMELPPENGLTEPLQIFSSILPLSERIRRKCDSNTLTKSKLEIEASLKLSLDSTFESKNHVTHEKKKISEALKELLEAKLDTEDDLPNKISSNSVDRITTKEKSITRSQIHSEEIITTQDSEEPSWMGLYTTLNHKNTKKMSIKTVKEEPLIKHARLKDPRTVVPNKLIAFSLQKNDCPSSIKRKLSISEYRKRKQQSLGTPPESENLVTSINNPSTIQDDLEIMSSGASSTSSDEENVSKMSLEESNSSGQPTFHAAEIGGEDGAMGWSAAPTLVERQRENLTERLKREFGLFLNDDEEEKTRKQGPSIDVSPKLSSSTSTDTASGINYPVMQLPPQPYIPPPGVPLYHCPEYLPKSNAKSDVVQHPIILQEQSTLPALPTLKIKESSTLPVLKGVNQQKQTCLELSSTQNQISMPQAPPGSNPYPPLKFSGVSQLPPPLPVPPPSTLVSARYNSPISKQPQVTITSVNLTSSSLLQKKLWVDLESES
ncbi:uncharacterized protein LOC106638130 isoform X2 [Copidosoma floridanum]|uniref:uncharacterized protein LOC106638130 isoform X2 n=1 Tax=Copidosoma floridanum TaxID=29053 RepID=UPI0006C965AC|nr:uncharacterized protein LOC106638130 isoform X2 [Copidosoma floridanum]